MLVFTKQIIRSNNLVTGDGEREFRTQSAQNFGDKMPMFTKTDKVFTKTDFIFFMFTKTFLFTQTTRSLIHKK